MNEIGFADEALYLFAKHLVGDQVAFKDEIRASDPNHSLGCTNAFLTQVLQRLDDGKPTVLPYRANRTDAWLFVGVNAVEQQKSFDTLSSFLIPTFAEYHPNPDFPQRRLFKPGRKSSFHEFGALLFPHGYYGMKSLSPDYKTIANKISIWASLEETHPHRTRLENPSYFGLNQKFNSALAVSGWAEAMRLIDKIRSEHLTTADNLAFLEIQRLEQMRDWQAIWDRNDFARLARLMMPRRVQNALLTAFYESVLAEYQEADTLAEGMERFRESIPRLGRLLELRRRISSPASIIVFAYQACLSGDIDELRRLELETEGASSGWLIKNLLAFCNPAESSASRNAPIVQQVKYAIAESNMDKALLLVAGVDDPSAKAGLLLELAFRSMDSELAEDALLYLWDLPEAQRSALFRASPHLVACERALKDLVGDGLDKAIRNWQDWLELFAEAPLDASLGQSIDNLAKRTTRGDFEIDELVKLSPLVEALVVTRGVEEISVARKAIRILTDAILQDESFPRESSIYDALFQGVVVTHDPNPYACGVLLRLAEGILLQSPSRAIDVSNDVSAWFAQPVPRLSNEYLAILELLGDFGVPGGAFAANFRMWVDQFFSLPRPGDTIDAEVWLSFAEWIQPGEDVIRSLKERLDDTEPHAREDLIRGLPTGYKITILSLRKSAADRAKRILEGLNPSLDVRVFSEKVPSDRSLASVGNSDLVVLTASCLTHSMYYSVRRLITADPVYPPSAGSSGIIAAVCERLAMGVPAPEPAG